ncbi:PREDICTED: uncharacterized protein LOC109336289 isoform X1 [Lupinus angustifolius]|uniref:uncharacterized protein LOC109336289 isoform X1 n=1 Tax=Lupinus angustifolius TaxID=3871 RepID=UPI00092FAC2C|nr:PREDICTED: uncharacterized protein LOC109336289 isoform X1 [Lupinus angustifolius]XP_019428343.1 PREDICTED: uncharacterized protein LOC109336289 isoform X1 [Lupinus angustifolius]
MGYNSVYRCLQDIFPQIDARLLKAVAIENPEDTDIAVEIVLTEIIPSMSKSLSPATPPQGKAPGALTNVQGEERWKSKDGDLLRELSVGSSAAHPIDVEMTKTSDFSSGLDLNVALHESTISNASNSNNSMGISKFLNETTELNMFINKFLNENKELNMFSNFEDNFSGEISNNITQETTINSFRQEGGEIFDQGRVQVDVGERLISSGVCQEMEPVLNFRSADNNCNGITNHLNEEWLDDSGHSADDNDASICHKNNLLEKSETLIEAESSEAHTDQGHKPNASDSLQSEFDSRCPISAGENLEDDSFFKLEFCTGETRDVEDETNENNSLSQSSEVCRIDLLQEIIDKSKTNKKTLFSSMESLINLMREVELQEKAAELANEEAARGGSDILARVEEYKTMLAHAKEANDMHAGEVYGEKAILATEMRELQSRLLNLSDERDKFLAILDEMRQILEARLAAAEEMRKSAEHDKLEKEESVRKALVEQEAMMEKVVQESVRLQKEAEENSQLQEFLMDRGQVVDMLQGEISVICQDIRLLKEKFDANIPLSKSFTSSQTSCILASSGLSQKAVTSGVGSEHSESSAILKISPAASVASLSSKSGHGEERTKANDQKALLDDGWDIFEKDAELSS